MQDIAFFIECPVHRDDTIISIKHIDRYILAIEGIQTTEQGGRFVPELRQAGCPKNAWLIRKIAAI